MSIQEKISELEIEEVLHFTTNSGLVGVFSTNKLVSRDHLKQEQALEYITRYNSKFRSDPQWTSFVNLSLSRINSSFFEYSKSWHHGPFDFWVILAFSPEILVHQGVVFTTTNNIYRRECIRGTGVTSLIKLFGQQVIAKRGLVKTRKGELPKNWTTCEEAEVLYPKEIDLEFLMKVYVPDEKTFALASAALSFDERFEGTIIEVNEEKFKGY